MQNRLRRRMERRSIGLTSLEDVLSRCVFGERSDEFGRLQSGRVQAQTTRGGRAGDLGRRTWDDGRRASRAEELSGRCGRRSARKSYIIISQRESRGKQRIELT